MGFNRALKEFTCAMIPMAGNCACAICTCVVIISNVTCALTVSACTLMVFEYACIASTCIFGLTVVLRSTVCTVHDKPVLGYTMVHTTDNAGEQPLCELHHSPSLCPLIRMFRFP